MFRDRPRRTVAAAVAAAASLGAVAFGLTSPHAASAAQEDTELRLTTVEKADTRTEYPKAGDHWVSYFDVHTTETGKDGKESAGRRVGDGSDRCDVVLARYEGVVTQCQRVLRTENGTLVLTSMTDRFGRGPHTGTAAVTGGTGAYAKARGEASLTQTDKQGSFRIRLRD
ncbi:hypothetical protein ACH4U6_03120 [Streptomyces netropsis]|uniref:hypothetical protein n=1 Tax=Streptomyces netropsis TaxID=55404 RepID=UPI0037B1D6B1